MIRKRNNLICCEIYTWILKNESLCCCLKIISVDRQRSAEKVEDELRSLKQYLQQKAEALENALDAVKLHRLGEMMSSQQARRSESEVMREEYERELLGLENQMRQKKDKQSKFLKEKLERRKREREAALIATGVSEDQAAAEAEQEMKVDAARQEKELHNAVDEENGRVRAEMDSNYTDDASKLRAAHEASLAALEKGVVEISASVQKSHLSCDRRRSI